MFRHLQYLVEVRDSLFRGREDFIYRLSIGALPYVTDIYPLGGKRGTSVTVELHGDVLVLETAGDRKYAREVLLPASVDAESLEKIYRNGILEIRLKKIKG